MAHHRHDNEDSGDISRSPSYTSTFTRAPSYSMAVLPTPSSNATISTIREGEDSGNVSRSPSYTSTFTRTPSYSTAPYPNQPSSRTPVIYSTESSSTGITSPSVPSSNATVSTIYEAAEDSGNVSRPTHASNQMQRSTYSTTAHQSQTRPRTVYETESSSTGIATLSLISSNATAVSTNYLHYRVYTEDSPVASTNPMYSNDSFLGRIEATSVIPPHKVANIKRNLCIIEGINCHARTDLFTEMSNQSPTHDDEHIPILDDGGPGSAPEKPMGLVVKSSDIAVKSQWNLNSIKLKRLMKRSKPTKTRYLYYRIYTAAKGEVSYKQSVRSNGHILGGIDADSVPPPHTVASLKRRIAKAEGIDNFSEYDLFVYLGRESPEADGPLSITTDNYPGSTPDRPMALVYSASSPPPIQIFPDKPPEFSTFTQRIKGKQDCYDNRHDPKFINFKKDEILFTDGRIERYASGGPGRGSGPKKKVYLAVNGSGRSGFVMEDAVYLLGSASEVHNNRS